MFFVIKRDGRKQDIHFDKITERISKLINPIELQSLNLPHLELHKEPQYLNPILVAQKVVSGIYSGIPTEKLDIESAEICVNLSTTHPSYSLLGGRILVSNLHKKTSSSFSQKMQFICSSSDVMDPSYVDWITANAEVIDSMVDYNRDYLYDYFGFKTLEKAYLLKVDGKIVERPQDMLMRCAIMVQKQSGNLEMIKQTYDLMSLGYYTHASPTLFNSLTKHRQLSSCFLIGTEDDLSGIANTWNSCAQISKWAGGIGLHVSNIRGKDSIIKGTGGRSNGLVPFLRVFNDIARWIDQGGRRPGSIAIYLEPHHPDIFEFLELRKNFGDENQRARDLFLALWVSDLFMKQVEVDGDWYLLSADECTGLTDAYGDDYEILYWQYVNEGKFRSKVKARRLWLAILDSQIETGMPYITYKDAVNKKSNQKNIGTIKSSNLCVHGETKILTSEGYQTISTLENQVVNVWNGEEWSEVTVFKTGTNKNLLRVTLSNGAYLDCTPEHKFYVQYENQTEVVEARYLLTDTKLIEYELPFNNKVADLYVVSVEPSHQNVDTYCFTEPKRHMGVFNGILTGQCNEIVEYSDDKEYAVCNLASIALKSFVVPFTFNLEKEWIVYSKPNCKYCRYAKNYLTSQNVPFTEVEFSNESLLKLKEILNTQKVTFPQIFTRSSEGELEHIGGWSNLYKHTASQFDYDKLYSIAYLATINLNQVIDVNYYPVPQTRFSNMRHRPIGLGIQGLADALVLMRIQFDSEEAVEFNLKYMETIYLASVTASNDLAKQRTEKMRALIQYFRGSQMVYPEYYDESLVLPNDVMNQLYHELKPCKYELDRDPELTTIGSYSSFDGSPFSEGKFQFDLWENKVNSPRGISPRGGSSQKSVLMYPDRWEQLREDVVRYGTRNSLLTALMPTASTSQILGNNECFEHFTNNIYTRKTQAGDFVLVNKYLVKDLVAVGIWSENLKNLIIANNGSVQSIDEIPPEMRSLYKTVWELKQVWVLKQAVARGAFVDQTQSMNIFMAEPDYQRLTSSHFYGWKNGLKTGMYYLRSKPSSEAIKFTVDPNLVKKTAESKEEPEPCLSCSG